LSGEQFDMSLYEALAVAVLVGVGCFAYRLYRQDTRPKTPGGPPSEAPPSRTMFSRTPQGPAGDDARP
jgi:hypothetical protein